MHNSNSLIRNGLVYDGLGNTPQHLDVRIRDGLIDEMAPKLLAESDETVIDATGLIVSPGLIDLHVHVFSGMGMYSVDPVDAGLKTGVTTMLDTGTAGSLSYRTFERFIMPQAEEDIYALLNISMIGAIQGHPDFPPYMGDLNDARHADVPCAVACVKQNPTRILGMKVRLTSGIANWDEKNEWAGFHGVFEAADQLGMPLMIHHIASKIPNTTVLDALRPGDMLTHMYHPHPDHGFDDRGMPIEAMQAARARGVIMDVGHGVGAFAWRVAEPACREYGFWPDTISTDIHQYNLYGPVFDMPTTMSKFLYLGMPMEKVIQASTSNAARAMGLADRLGSLTPGLQADVVLLERKLGKFPLTDVEYQTRFGSERLVARSVCKRGKWTACRG